MSFLNPWLLLGALAVGVPILVHLLNRYRVQTTDWGAMMLLRRAFRVRARQIKLRDILLLILRCAIVLLIALALTRPTVRPESGTWMAGRQSVGTVIAIDASYSMQHKAGAKSRFDEALDTVRQIAGTFRHGQPLTLVLMGHHNEVLLRDAGYSRERLEKVLNDLTPTAETLNLEFCINELKPLVRELKSGERELFLVTDAQKQDWLHLSDAARQDLKDMGSTARVFLLPIGSPNEENLAITRLELVSGTLRRGSVVRYAATIANFGKQPRRGVKAMLDVNGAPVDERRVELIKPGQSVTVPLFLPLNDAGVIRLSARLDHDELLTDNQRNAVADVRSSTAVLCVDGAPSMEPFQGAADYLTQAVGSGAGPAASSVKRRVVCRTLPFLSVRQ